MYLGIFRLPGGDKFTYERSSGTDNTLTAEFTRNLPLYTDLSVKLEINSHNEDGIANGRIWIETFFGSWYTFGFGVHKEDRSISISPTAKKYPFGFSGEREGPRTEIIDVLSGKELGRARRIMGSILPTSEIEQFLYGPKEG